MKFTIKKARIPQWGYEITAHGYHNIAPSVPAAVRMLRDRFGNNVRIRIIDDDERGVRK